MFETVDQVGCEASENNGILIHGQMASQVHEHARTGDRIVKMQISSRCSRWSLSLDPMGGNNGPRLGIH